MHSHLAGPLLCHQLCGTDTGAALPLVLQAGSSANSEFVLDVRVRVPSNQVVLCRWETHAARAMHSMHVGPPSAVLVVPAHRAASTQQWMCIWSVSRVDPKQLQIHAAQSHAAAPS